MHTCKNPSFSVIGAMSKNVSKCQCHTGTRCQKQTFLTYTSVNLRCESLPTANNPNNPSNLMLTTYRAKMSKSYPWDFRAFVISMGFPRKTEVFSRFPAKMSTIVNIFPHGGMSPHCHGFTARLIANDNIPLFFGSLLCATPLPCLSLPWGVRSSMGCPSIPHLPTVPTR